MTSLRNRKAGAWAMLFALPGGKWKVDGGCTSGVAFFLEGATKAQLQRYTDPSKCRFVWCPEGVRVGAIVTLSVNGKAVTWPQEEKIPGCSRCGGSGDDPEVDGCRCDCCGGTGIER